MQSFAERQEEYDPIRNASSLPVDGACGNKCAQVEYAVYCLRCSNVLAFIGDGVEKTVDMRMTCRVPGCTVSRVEFERLSAHTMPPVGPVIAA